MNGAGRACGRFLIQLIFLGTSPELNPKQGVKTTKNEDYAKYFRENQKPPLTFTFRGDRLGFVRNPQVLAPGGQSF